MKKHELHAQFMAAAMTGVLSNWWAKMGEDQLGKPVPDFVIEKSIELANVSLDAFLKRWPDLRLED